MVTRKPESSRPAQAFDRRMRAEIRLFAIIALLVFVAAIVLPSGDWLGKLLAEQAYNADEIVVAVVAVSFVALVFLLRGWRDVRQGAMAIEQLQARGAVDGLLSQMTGLLHACLSLDEASTIIAHFARQLFPDHRGVLYVFRSSRNLLEEMAVWGEIEHYEPIFGPQQCWALRQGQIFIVSDRREGIRCEHVRHEHPYICLPLMAHGEVLALLHITPNEGLTDEQKRLEPHEDLVRVFTERIAPALSNLKLRESLRQQSIRDPLTGLFNRRYLEETLLIEMERARRSDTPFSILMLDLDHFKRFNDTHGHEAGDAVLQTLGSFLQRHVRGGDIACRYGGEEFTLILPATSIEAAQQRAQELCEGIRTLNIDFKNQILGPLTLSVGVASFPTHGETGDLVLHAADVALYQAKAEGRDRIALAP